MLVTNEKNYLEIVNNLIETAKFGNPIIYTGVFNSEHGKSVFSYYQKMFSTRPKNTVKFIECMGDSELDKLNSLTGTVVKTKSQAWSKFKDLVYENPEAIYVIKGFFDNAGSKSKALFKEFFNLFENSPFKVVFIDKISLYYKHYEYMKNYSDFIVIPQKEL